MRDEVSTDLDRQIQEALDVDPSPDFQAPRANPAGRGATAIPRRAAAWLLGGVGGARSRGGARRVRFNAQ